MVKNFKKIKLLFLPVLTCFWFQSAVAWSSSQQPLTAKDVVPMVNRYCGACHAVPSPNILPKRNWPSVIDAMADLARERIGDEFISGEHLRHIKALYYGSSPEQLPRLPYVDSAHPELTFHIRPILEKTRAPQVFSIQSVDLGRGSGHSFLVGDGESGRVMLLEAIRQDGGLAWRETALADIALPIAIQAVDYSGDGRPDILVAELGVLPPGEEKAGKVYLLEQDKTGAFTRKLLLDGVGRVSDARAVDLNGDGRLDLAIAVFGGGRVGEAFWMENRGNGTYEKHELLPLSGVINLIPTDLNGDSKVDLVALLSQEYEQVIAFINRGEGDFERHILAGAPHPMFGMTSLIVEDLNNDGYPDLVFTNGDAFDTQNDPKPYHGVQWLENKGGMRFQLHDIGRVYGAAKASVGDLNGDGHPDIVVSSWINDWDDPERQSLVWFENDGRQNFTPHPVAGNLGGVVPVTLMDITGDGRLDILAGAFRMDILKILYTGNEAEKAKANTSEHNRLMLIVNEKITAEKPVFKDDRTLGRPDPVAVLTKQ